MVEQSPRKADLFHLQRLDQSCQGPLLNLRLDDLRERQWVTTEFVCVRVAAQKFGGGLDLVPVMQEHRYYDVAQLAEGSSRRKVVDVETVQRNPSHLQRLLECGNWILAVVPETGIPVRIPVGAGVGVGDKKKPPPEGVLNDLIQRTGLTRVRREVGVSIADNDLVPLSDTHSIGLALD